MTTPTSPPEHPAPPPPRPAPAGAPVQRVQPVQHVQVACLCAAWCRLCDSYAPVLQAVVAEFSSPGLHLESRWIDIEDEAELVGEVEVETFPTLVILAAGRVLFAGPLTPQADTLKRVLRSAVEQALQGTPVAAVDASWQDFAARLAAATPPGASLKRAGPG